MTQIGDRVQGKLDAYIIEEVLADGRFGETFLARRVSDEDDVVIKTIALERAASSQDMEIFERESARLRQLDHPSIAPYLDAMVLQKGQHAELGLVQSYVTTSSLREWASGRGIVDLDANLDWFDAALDALVYVHELEPPVVHGDLDAGNILLHSDDSIQIVDFATARQRLLSAERLATGLARGQLDYAPIEQLRGQAVPATDLYALAMTFLATISRSEPESFPTRGLRPDVKELLPYGTDEALVSLFERMTETDPGDRLDSARIALERLRALRGAGLGEDDSLFEDEPDREEAAPAGPMNLAARDRALLDLMRGVHDLHGAIPEGEAWERGPEVSRGRVHAFGIDKNGTHMVLARKHSASILSVDRMDVRGELSFGELARRIAVSPDGKRVAVLTGFEDLLLFDVNVSIWQRHHVVVEGMWPGNSQLTFRPDGEVVAISDDDQVNLYAWESGELLARHDVDGQFGLEYSPDGQLLFAVGDDHTTLIDGDAYQRIDIDGIAFSPDGTMAAITREAVVTVGHFRSLRPEITWAHDDRRLRIDGADRARLNMLRFGPDQRLLYVGSSTGFWRLIDTRELAVLPFQDQARADDRTKVKIFEVGFGADGRRLLMHANLHPDELGTDRMGCVLAWKVPEGRFLGSMLWLDYGLSVMTSPGFYGEVDELGSRGFSSDRWDRPELAGPLFQGKDPEGLLSETERAQLREFHLRRVHLMRAREHSGEAYFDLDDALEALAGLSHVALAVFEQADERRESYASLDYGGASHGMDGHLEDAAFDLDADYSPEQLVELHERLLEEAARPPGERDMAAALEAIDDGHPYADLGGTPPPGISGRPAYAARTEYEDTRPVYAPRGAYGESRSPQNTPTVSDRRERERREREERGGSSSLARPLDADPEDYLEVLDEQEEADSSQILLAFVLACVLGFGTIFGVFYFLDHQTLTGAVFWGLLLGAGPALTFFFYTTVTRRLAGV